MPKIAINLLPIEFKTEQVKRAKFYKVQAIGIATIMFVTFLSSLTIALRILQSHNIDQIENRLSQSEKKISDFKETQASLLLLKNRLTAINQYLGNPSKQAQIYKLVIELLPKDVSLSSISIDKEGNALLLAVSPSGDTIDTLINNLISRDKNQDKISQVSLEGLSRGKDQIYRITFKVVQKK